VPANTAQTEAVERVAARVRELAADYSPPGFGHVPTVDSALFLCAIDHRTGYRGRYLVGGKGPWEGSALLWALGCAADRRQPGALSASRLAAVSADEVVEMFRIGGETVHDPDVRAWLWRDLSTRLLRDHGGTAEALLGATEGRLGGQGGLLALLGDYEAFSDPLAKKALLFAKIAERRGWLLVADPDRWEVCADNVLMRLALRSGLVRPGGLEGVRTATRQALNRVAEEAGMAPPVLDDLLWELGSDSPDLLGAEAGDLREPPRDPGSHWY
jgi:hypothetical protein